MKRDWQALGIAPAREMGLEAGQLVGELAEKRRRRGACSKGPAAMEAAPVRVSVVLTT